LILKILADNRESDNLICVPIDKIQSVGRSAGSAGEASLVWQLSEFGFLPRVLANPPKANRRTAECKMQNIEVDGCAVIPLRLDIRNWTFCGSKNNPDTDGAGREYKAPGSAGRVLP